MSGMIRAYNYPLPADIDADKYVYELYREVAKNLSGPEYDVGWKRYGELPSVYLSQHVASVGPLTKVAVFMGTDNFVLGTGHRFTNPTFPKETQEDVARLSGAIEALINMILFLNDCKTDTWEKLLELAKETKDANEETKQEPGNTVGTPHVS